MNFFILGCSRSGTTLLASLLNGHPKIIVAPETWWLATSWELGLGRINTHFQNRAFLYLISRNTSSAANADMREKCRTALRDLMGFRGAYDEALRAFAASLRHREDATCFGEKTPAHTTFAGEVVRTFPDFKKIVILRDPRDITCSYLSSWYDGITREGLIEILTTLKVYLRNLLLELRDVDVCTIRYEALTREPHRQLEVLCRYLEVRPMSKHAIAINPTTTPVGIHQKLTEQVVQNSGHFRSLPSHVLETIEYVLFQEMGELGYRHVHSRPRPYDSMFERIASVGEELFERSQREKDSRRWRARRLKIAKVYMKYLLEGSDRVVHRPGVLV